MGNYNCILKFQLVQHLLLIFNNLYINISIETYMQIGTTASQNADNPWNSSIHLPK